MKSPKVSVVTPTFNRPGPLERLLQSVIQQSFRNFEMIVVDDGSADRKTYTRLISVYRKRVPGLRLIRNQVNRGAPYCRNLGIRAARHPLVALIDDDELFPEKLKLQVEAFRDHWDDTEIVYSWVEVRDEVGRVLRRIEPRVSGNALWEDLEPGFFPPTSALMFKRDSLLEVGLFDETLASCQEWDLCLRLFQKGARCRPVEKVLSIYNLQEGSIQDSPKFRIGVQAFIRKHWKLYLSHRPLALAHLLLIVFSRRLNIRPGKRWGNLFRRKPHSTTPGAALRARRTS
jgi:glycosyltransferase involved in cell wall biosynthesis